MNQKKILIVDDDADIALIIKDNMELDGYLVEVSSNGKRFSGFSGYAHWILVIVR